MSAEATRRQNVGTDIKHARMKETCKTNSSNPDNVNAIMKTDEI